MDTDDRQSRVEQLEREIADIRQKEAEDVPGGVDVNRWDLEVERRTKQEELDRLNAQGDDAPTA